MISRTEAVAAALAWKGTPYVTGGRVRGGGCDCATFVAEYLIEIGAAVPALLRYTQDWFCHTQKERYFNELSKYATCTWEGRCCGAPPALPGDIAIYKVAGSRVYNHGSIITGWPRALHAFDQGVCESRPALHPLTAHMAMAVFSPWGKHEEIYASR